MSEWPDVQLSFDVGGGRYLRPRSSTPSPSAYRTAVGSPIDWSYLDVHERDDDSSDSGDEYLVEGPHSMSNLSGYMGQKGPTHTPYAGRRRRTERRDSASASLSQAPPELEKCKLCPLLGPRHEWTRLGHGGFCSEGHKWQWEETYPRNRNVGE